MTGCREREYLPHAEDKSQRSLAETVSIELTNLLRLWVELIMMPLWPSPQYADRNNASRSLQLRTNFGSGGAHAAVSSWRGRIKGDLREGEQTAHS